MLLDLFRVDESDLAANRAGSLGPGQQARMRRGGWAYVAFAVFGAAFLVWSGFVSGPDPESPDSAAWIGMDLFALVFLAIPLGGAWWSFRHRTGGVRALTGRVKVTRKISGPQAHTVTQLAVGGMQCLIANPKPATIKAWNDAFGDSEHVVYVVGGRTLVAVAAEPALMRDTAPPEPVTG